MVFYFKSNPPEMLHVFLVVLGSIGLCFASVNKTSNHVSLSPLKISSVTVSGISSGASMAVQMHVSYSQIISGVAAFAGVRIIQSIDS